MNYTINECLGSTLGIHILLICLALILHGDMIGCNLFAFLRYECKAKCFSQFLLTMKGLLLINSPSSFPPQPIP